jgi:DNA-binding transcriptional regulator YiaG
MNVAQALLLAEAREKAASGEAETLRLGAGFSQVETAQVLGVDSTTVSRWERQLRRPRGMAGVRYGRFLRRLADRVPS